MGFRLKSIGILDLGPKSRYTFCSKVLFWLYMYLYVEGYGAPNSKAINQEAVCFFFLQNRCGRNLNQIMLHYEESTGLESDSKLIKLNWPVSP